MIEEFKGKEVQQAANNASAANTTMVKSTIVIPKAIPRRPTTKEVRELVEYQITHFGQGDETQDKEDWQDWVQIAYIAVYDNYVSDSPGYVGKVMTVIWAGGPSAHEIYVWLNGKIDRQRHAHACENCKY